MVTQVQTEIERELASKAGSLTERIAERLGGAANARAVYTVPVERDGVTVIGVARVRWAFGGGDGRDSSGSGSGSGGGGGVSASPIGYIELKDGEAHFRPITDPTSVMTAALPLVIAGCVTCWVVLRGLRRLVRGH